MNVIGLLLIFPSRWVPVPCIGARGRNKIIWTAPKAAYLGYSDSSHPTKDQKQKLGLNSGLFERRHLQLSENALDFALS